MVYETLFSLGAGDATSALPTISVWPSPTLYVLLLPRAHIDFLMRLLNASKSLPTQGWSQLFPRQPPACG